MQQFYDDEDASASATEAARLIPASLRGVASAAIFVSLVAGLGVWAYRLGTRDAAEVPIIRAMEGPTRLQPEEPGGFQAAHQGHEVNSVLEGTPAPIPRDAARPLPTPVALTAEDGPQGELILAARVPVPETGDAAAIEAPAPSEGIDLVEPGPDLEEEAVPGEPGGLSPAELAAAAIEEPVSAAPAGPRPRVRPANLARVRPPAAPPKPAAAAEAPAAAPAAAPAREVANLDAGTRLVQLGAFDSEEITRKAWARLVASHGDLLGPKSLYVERTTGNARVFYRLRVAGFANTDQTRDMCEALRARGVDCIPVTLQ